MRKMKVMVREQVAKGEVKTEMMLLAQAPLHPHPPRPYTITPLLPRLQSSPKPLNPMARVIRGARC